MKADLHIHSIYSDGKLNIQELADYAELKNIDVIAITDHDTVGSYKEVTKVKSKVKVLIGVELSAYMNDENIHVLGYFYNNKKPSKELVKYLKERDKKRKIRAHEIIRRLKSYYNIDIIYEEASRLADGVIGRAHIARAIERKYGTPFQEIFEKYLGDNNKAYIPIDNLSVVDAIDMLKRNNALVVLAHPILIKNSNVEDIIKCGIEGIEIKFPMNDRDTEKRFYKIAKKYNLIITGGSDFHSPNARSDLGDKYIEGNELEDFLNIIDKR